MTTIPDTPELDEILLKFANYWRNDPQNLLEKLNPSEAKAAIKAYATAQADRARQEAFTLGFRAATEAANGTMLGTTWEESKKIIEVNQKSHYYDDLSNKGEAKHD